MLKFIKSVDVLTDLTNTDPALGVGIVSPFLSVEFITTDVDVF